MKIAVCCPTTGLIRAKCAQALNALVAHTLSARVSYNGSLVQPKLAFLYDDAGPLEYKRTRLALGAMSWGADYHLLLDWDHIFPVDALLRLAGHNLPFVAANYMQRHEHRTPVAMAGEHLVATGQGVQEVAAVGLGFALIRTEVFRATPQPWFRSEFTAEGAMTCGEDVYFCNQVRSAGFPIHVDHGLPVGHIAETVLMLERGAENADTVLPASGAQ